MGFSLKEEVYYQHEAIIAGNRGLAVLESSFKVRNTRRTAVKNLDHVGNGKLLVIQYCKKCLLLKANMISKNCIVRYYRHLDSFVQGKLSSAVL